MKRPDLIGDVLYPQLRKTLNRIENALLQQEFLVLRSNEFVWDGQMFLLFELERWNLPRIKKMIGPPIHSHKHTKEFLSKYRKPDFGPYVEDSRWVVDKKREFTDARDYFKHIVKNAEAIGVPDNIAKAMKKSRISSQKEFWNFVKKNKQLSALLRERYFSRINLA